MQPIRVSIGAGVGDSRAKKDGTVTVYQCPSCHKQGKNLGQVRKHISTQCRQVAESSASQHKRIINNYEKRVMEVHQHQQQPQEKTDFRIQLDKIPQAIRLALEVTNRKLEKLQEDNAELRKIIKPQEILNLSQIAKQSSRLATEITSNCIDYFRSVMKVKLYEVIYSAFRNGIKVVQKTNQIMKSVYEKLNCLDLGDCIDGFKEKLKQFHHNLMEQKKHLSKVTLTKYQTSYRFLLKYDEHHMVNQTKLISDLLCQSTWMRTKISKYYAAMIKYQPSQFPYKHLPRKVKTYITLPRNPPPPIKLYQIRQDVMSNLDEKPSFACDLWIITVMGFRRPELLRMYFRGRDSKEFAAGVKIVEQKNRHQTIRILPESAKMLISLTETTYPITQDRLEAVRKFCLQRYRRFYNLRALCLTTIISSLFQTNMLARTHKASETVHRHYLDQNSFQLINQAFSLPLKNKIQVKTQPYLLNFGVRNEAHQEFFDLTEQKEALQKPAHQQFTQIADQDAVSTLEEEDICDALSKNIYNMKDHQVLQLVSGFYMLKKHNTVLQEKKYSYLQQALEILFADKKVKSVLSAKLSQFNQQDYQHAIRLPTIEDVGKMFQYSISHIMMELALLYRTTVNYVEFQTNRKDPRHERQYAPFNFEVKVTIAQICASDGTYYVLGQSRSNQRGLRYYEMVNYCNSRQKFDAEELAGTLQELEKTVNRRKKLKGEDGNPISIQYEEGSQVRVPRASKQKANANLKQVQQVLKTFQLTFMPLYCRSESCRSSCIAIVAIKCPKLQHMVLSCPDCGQLEHKCEDYEKLKWKNPFKSRESVNYLPDSLNQKQLSEVYLNLTLSQHPNNFRVTISQDYNYTNQLQYVFNLPATFTCRMPVCSKILSQAISFNRQNQQHLPMEIMSSSIPSAGLGVFAKVDIPKGTLICVYSGQVGYHDTLFKTDSVFTLGWVRLSKNTTKGLFISPHRYSNVGRYLNTHTNHQKINCQAKVVLVQYATARYQLIPIIYSLKFIPSGSQLFYSYGKEYDLPKD